MSVHSFTYYQVATYTNTEYRSQNLKYNITFGCLLYNVFLLSWIYLMAMLAQ